MSPRPDEKTRVGSSRDGASSAGVSRRRTGSSSHRDDAKTIGQWRIGRTIGKGSSGRVKIAKHSITGKYAAIKIVPKGAILTSRLSVAEAGARADKVMLGIEREIVIMKLIDHPNVLNLYDVWETSSELYLIMEYVPGGELFDYLVKRGRLPVSEALHYFQQIIYAVDYCHRFNICHRDLKPENLLLDKDKNIKVADFGMAAWEAGERMLETSCGSPHYASPEIVAGKAYHGNASDIWSCGIILFALLTGRLPFDDDNIRSLLQKVKVGVFEMPDEIKGDARDLLRKMLEKDPERRITMPEILTHPFFTSRSPRAIPGRQFVSPPSLDEVERPVNSEEDIDSDIMGNLKTLWSGATDEEIVAALMSKEKTWEKAIYHLLIKYRNKHLENYNMDDEEDAEARARRQARREREGKSAPSPAKRKGGAPTKAPRLTPLSENDTIQDRAPSPVSRPQAPTPKKAAGAAEFEISPDGRSLGIPKGPRPPVSNRNSYASSNDTPSIVLQEATPTKDYVTPSLVSGRPRSMGMEPPSPSMPATPQMGAPPLNVPLVQDEQLQHFFNEVANQLNTMNIRSSVASGSSTNSAGLGADIHAYMAYANGGSSSTPVSPVLEDVSELETMDPNQFADADDDDTELASEYSHAPSIVGSVHSHSHSYSQQSSPMVGLGFGQPSAHSRPGLYPTHGQSQNPHRWSYASSAGSSRHPAESPLPQLYTPGPWSPQPEHAAVLQAHRAAPAPPPRTNTNTATATRPAPPPPIRPVSTVGRSTGDRGLTRDESYVMIDNADVPASDSSWGSKQSGFSAHRNAQDAFGMLKKRKKVTIDPVPYSSDFAGPPTGASALSTSSASTVSSPKRSWFNNLFSFKPASCTLLSRDNVANTRDRTRRALLDLGVRVSIAEVDGLRALKCRLDEVRDPTGNNTVVKGVRFRVEFARSNTTSSPTYNTLVSLTQEKGAQSSFKGIFNSLRTVLENEQLQQPRSAPPTQTQYSRSAPNSLGASGRPVYTHQPMSYQYGQSQTHTSYVNSPNPGYGAIGNGDLKANSLAAPQVRFTHSAPNSPVPPSTPRFAASPKMPVSPQLQSGIRM